MRTARRRTVGAAVALACALGACATYTDRLAVANYAASTGSYQGALGELNKLLGVSSADQISGNLNGDRSLALLERGSLQQAVTRYPGSSRDFETAEQHLEVLDMTANGVATLGSYLYSDSVKTYKTPPSERLAINAINLQNYLALGDIDGAAVEARRFQVMREYLDSQQIDASGPATLGTYLAGFVFERRGEGDRALRYYEEALGPAPLESLAGPVARLARVNPYRGPRIKEILSRGGGGETKAGAELLIVLNLGRVPHKIPARIPVGAAIGIAGTAFTGDIDVLKYSATKVLVYPELAETPSTLGPPEVRVDGAPVGVELVTDLGTAIRSEYQQAKPKIIAAALTRVASRAGVAEGVRVAGNQQSQLLGDLLSVATESVLVALDKPDTRSWTALPDRVFVARVPVAPGDHGVEVDFQGTAAANRSFTAQVPDGGFTAVVVTEPR